MMHAKEHDTDTQIMCHVTDTQIMCHVLVLHGSGKCDIKPHKYSEEERKRRKETKKKKKKGGGGLGLGRHSATYGRDMRSVKLWMSAGLPRSTAH